LFEIHAEFTKLEKIEFTGIKGKQLSSQTMQIFDDFNELYKKFTFVTYDPLNPEDVVSIQFDLTKSVAITRYLTISFCHIRTCYVISTTCSQ